ncbi:MAG: metallophosphoesterase [Clostridia bacterium]|nr:metallophosphoesterase [Clostridia bacterium]
MTEPIRKRNIPFAIVFGNHDSELEQFFREYQMMLYMRYDNFIGCLNAEEMHGCGNNNVIIKSSKSDKAAFNIWLIDSNDYVRDENYKVLGYDRIHQDQLDWYERTAEKLKKENGGEPLPSILFQHIPVSQEYDVIYEAGENEPCDLVEGDGKRYCIKKENFVSGHLRELPCPPKDRSREQFDLWKKQGDVIAAFFGHDHVNDFIFDIDGIKLCQTLATGFHTYGDIHGGRLIVLDENNPREFYTESIEIERITDTNFN